MDLEVHKSSRKYRTYAFALLFMTTLTLYMLYIQTYAQINQNIFSSTLLEYRGTTACVNFSENMHEGVVNNSAAPEYLICSSKCRIPNLNPFSEDVKKLYTKHSYRSCTKKPLLSYVTVNGSKAILQINESAISYYSKNGVHCCYRSVTRQPSKANPDKTIKVSICTDFRSNATLPEDVVIVECRNNETNEKIYKNAHAAITLKESVIRKSLVNTEKPLSVLFIGIDSVSRLNFIREMPITRSYLEKNHWLELRGYNKIADNTFPNLMAILTGMNESTAYYKCKPNSVGYLDKCKMVWYDFRDLGYVTAYAEDESKITTFNYHKKGFVKPPTDYYFRPYMLASEDQLVTSTVDDMTYCTGPETSGERILHLAKDFAEKFKERPYFGFFWMNTFSHNRLNSLSRMDNKVHEFLQELGKSQILNNTIVVFFSDHGLRFGEIRYTRTGWLEERLPIFFMSLPEWFKQSYPEKYNNLVTNQERLTTPYDVHMMLQDLLVISGKNYSIKPSSACPKCKSLFEQQEVNRSCEDAAIEQHWCTCGGYVGISTENSTVKAATKYVLEKIHETIQTNGGNFQKCRKYTIKKIKSSSISKNDEDWYKNDTYLLIIFETIPDAVFEATVSVELKNKTLDFKMEGSISRLDYYKPHSNCINISFLKKYCYCKR